MAMTEQLKIQQMAHTSFFLEHIFRHVYLYYSIIKPVYPVSTPLSDCVVWLNACRITWSFIFL